MKVFTAIIIILLSATLFIYTNRKDDDVKSVYFEQKQNIILDSKQNKVFEDINNYRKSLHLNELELSKQLMESAKNKADHLCSGNYWSHDLPDGSGWYIFVDNTNLNYKEAGENLSRGYSESKVLKAWQDSASHDRNLKYNWSKIGIGYRECNGKNYIVTHFANF